YKASTVLDLLGEVYRFQDVQDVKIDWNALVKQTKTGITNPREYQMLWRHLAYCDPLIDDDLEYELEAFPTVSNEASAEAAACVKVLIDSGSSSDSCLEKGLTIEAPLTINIPNNKLENPQLGSSSYGINITIPVSVPKQTLPTVSSAEGLDTNGYANSNLPPRRKRKPWSADEDKELFAAVQRCGEGNWANILKGDFKGDRTASQLSQQLNHQNGLTTFGGSNLSVQPTVAEPSSAGALPQNQSQPDSKRAIPRSQPFPTRPSAKPLTSGPDAVKAAAVAAGARIATQSAAAAILKAQLKSAIHIKTTTSGNTRPSPATHMGSDYFRDRYSSMAANAPRANLGSSHANPNVGLAVQQVNPGGSGPDVNIASETSDGTEVKPSGSASSMVEPVQEDQVAVCGGPVVVQDNLGLKDEDLEEQPPPVSGNPPNSNLESE
ncbi:Homeodomain-like protein, partial [Cynara cardunculus var. scolymus]